MIWERVDKYAIENKLRIIFYYVVLTLSERRKVLDKKNLFERRNSYYFMEWRDKS